MRKPANDRRRHRRQHHRHAPGAGTGATGEGSRWPLRPAAHGAVHGRHSQALHPSARKIPIIGVGGIETAEDTWEKLIAGADLVQIYSVLIYDGPGVVREIAEGLAEKVKASGRATLSEAVAKARTV